MTRDLDQVSARTVKTLLRGGRAKTKVKRGDREC